MDKKNKSLVIFSISFCLLITIIFIIRLFGDDYTFWSSSEIKYDVTGQIGDFIGGVIGTILSGVGFYFLYITFNNQQSSFERERLESKYFELIKLHRDNVSELKFSGKGLAESYDSLFIDKIEYEGKSVFKAIFNQFIICKNELTPFFRRDKIYLPEYEKKLNNQPYIKDNNINLLTLAKIDICYSIVFYGVSSEGLLILEELFKDRYKPKFIGDILRFISLKPAYDKEIFKKWQVISGRNTRGKRTELVTDIYNWRKTRTIPINSIFSTTIINYHNRYVKYYGGHQFRLGHYFRHLYQTIKFINNSTHVDFPSKYEYIKILRTQLSTYEQAILFTNSLCKLGKAWEMDPEINPLLKSFQFHDFQIITKYNLIKNLPGEVIYGIPFKKFYPSIEYENESSKKTRKIYK